MPIWDMRPRCQLVGQQFHMLSISTGGSPVLVPHTIIYWVSRAIGHFMGQQFYVLLESYSNERGWSSILS